MDNMKIFSGRSNLPLAEEIVNKLGIPLSSVDIGQFSDGELSVKYKENIRGEDVFIVQSTNPPAENILELVLLIDAAVRASANRVTVVIPYYGYGRQDRKDQPRVPISARAIMDMINSVGANRILTMDLHSSQIQGFTNMPFDHLYARRIIFDRLRTLDLNPESSVILAPDAGSARMAQSFAKHLGTGFAMVDKRRPAPNKAEVVHVIGDLDKKQVIIVDDMIDTGGTMVNAAHMSIDKGAVSVIAVVTHGILSGDAPEKIMNSPIEKLIATNTIDIPENRKIDTLELISVAGLFSEAINCIHNGESISALFEF